MRPKKADKGLAACWDFAFLSKVVFNAAFFIAEIFLKHIKNKWNFTMAVNSATSFVLSSILTLLIFSGMQMYKPVLIRSPVTIIFGGYLGSLMFLFFVTAIGNLEATMFGKNFQLKLPEVVLSMAISLIAAGMVHRICFTTCLIFSIITIYYMNKLSQKAYATAAPVAAPAKSRRHK